MIPVFSFSMMFVADGGAEPTHGARDDWSGFGSSQAVGGVGRLPSHGSRIGEVQCGAEGMGDVGRERRPVANGRDAIKNNSCPWCKTTSCVWLVPSMCVLGAKHSTVEFVMIDL